MKNSSNLFGLICVAFTVIVFGGFWLGAYSWFGGYIWVKQAVGGTALAIGILMAVACWCAFPHRWSLYIGMVFASQLLFFAALAAGQVFYVGPSTVNEAVRLFTVAMQGGL